MSDLSLKPNHKKDFRRRVIIVLLLFFTCLIFLLFKIGELQLIKGDKFYHHAKKLVEKEAPVRPSRGEILDRNNQPLVTKKPAFRVGLILSYYLKDPDKEEKLSILSKKIDVSVSECKKKIDAGIKLWKEKNILNPYRAEITLKNNASREEAIWIMERMNTDDFSWIRCEEKEFRYYTMGKNLSHLLGFVSSIDPDTYSKKSKNKYDGRPIYRLDSEIGQIGIEYKLDTALRGVYGIRYEQVNAKGRMLVKEIPGKTIDPIHGNNVKLTIDKGIQTAAYRAIKGLEDKNGAVIVTKPATGEVLAMVSNPGFDANTYNKDFVSLTKDERKPLINRVYNTLVPPGSIFKLVVAASGLESRKWSIGRKNTCTGVYHIPTDRSRHPYRCMGVHGSIDLLTAIRKSCNSYFYNLGYNIGWDTIYEYGHEAFCLGLDTGLDFGRESTNFYPSRDDVRDLIFHDKHGRAYNYRWQYGDTVVASIGQGFILLTPLQIHNIVSLICNDGKLMKPFVIQKISNPNNSEVVLDVDPETRYAKPKKTIRLKTIRFLQKAMSEVPKEGGTAYWLCGKPFVDGQSTYKVGDSYYDKIMIAGKTGTCQNPDSDIPHAMFTSYAPYNAEDPKDRIAITVFVEHGGTGGAHAAPIAAAIYNYIFNTNEEERSVEYFYTKKLHLEYKPTEEEIREKELLNKKQEEKLRRETQEVAENITKFVDDYMKALKEYQEMDFTDEEADDDTDNTDDKDKKDIKDKKDLKDKKDNKDTKKDNPNKIKKSKEALNNLKQKKENIEKMMKDSKLKADINKIIPVPKEINKKDDAQKNDKKVDKSKPKDDDKDKKEKDEWLKAPIPDIDINQLRKEIKESLTGVKTKEREDKIKQKMQEADEKRKANQKALEKIQKEEMQIKPDADSSYGDKEKAEKIKEIKEKEENKAINKYKEDSDKDKSNEKSDDKKNKETSEKKEENKKSE